MNFLKAFVKFVPVFVLAGLMISGQDALIAAAIAASNNDSCNRSDRSCRCCSLCMRLQITGMYRFRYVQRI